MMDPENKTKFKKKDTLELELELVNRRRVYEFINTNPGFHLREIQRKLDMPIGLLKFHIQYLIKHEIIVEKAERIVQFIRD